MLLSPGNSPRHLSSPSPSMSSEPTACISSSSINPSATPPWAKKRPMVLDENTYVAAIEKIIERDYFPDIPKLRDRLDWLEAVRSSDPLQICDAQLKIMERRQGKGSSADHEGKLRTPGSTFFRSSVTPFETRAGIDRNSGGDERFAEGNHVDVSLSLDQFFRRYTSEDNASFSKLIEKVNRKRKERFVHLLEGEDVRSITDGYGTSFQPISTLQGCKYTTKNLLMYHSADRGESPLTNQEMAERLKGLTKEISKSNTRFHGKIWDSTSIEIGSEKKRVNGYDLVKTPSPAPGVDEYPFITWGEIEGSPLRLDPEDTTSEEPRCKIPSMASRDAKARSLPREAARKVNERSIIFQKPPLARTLSCAARKFVRNAIAKSSSNVDRSLRASFRVSSSSVQTPKSVRSLSKLGKSDTVTPPSPCGSEGSCASC